jgi:hypothetical protein
MKCPQCGIQNETSAHTCILCGLSLEGTDELAPGAARRSRASVGGTLIILSGIMGMLNGIYFIAPGSFGLDPTNITWIGDPVAFGYLTIAAAMVGVVGGLSSLQRTAYPLCVAGGFLAALSLGFTIGFFIGIAGMALVGSSRKEFVRGTRFG